MAGVPDTLREIHRLRRHARDLHRPNSTAAPSRSRPARASPRRPSDALQAGPGRPQEAQDQDARERSHLQDDAQQIDKYVRQKGDAAEAKQIAAFEHQIATAKAKAEALENETLEAYTAIEEKTAALPGVEAAAKKAQGRPRRVGGAARRADGPAGRRLEGDAGRGGDARGRPARRHRAAVPADGERLRCGRLRGRRRARLLAVPHADHAAAVARHRRRPVRLLPQLRPGPVHDRLTEPSGRSGTGYRWASLRDVWNRSSSS